MGDLGSLTYRDGDQIHVVTPDTGPLPRRSPVTSYSDVVAPAAVTTEKEKQQ